MEKVAVEGDQGVYDSPATHPHGVGESTRGGPGEAEDELELDLDHGQGHGQGDEDNRDSGDHGAMNSSGCGGDANGDAAGDKDSVEGSKSAKVKSKDDADFDDLLASYLDGLDGEDDGSGSGSGSGGGAMSIFGKAGGSLLMPLGALRLLR